MKILITGNNALDFEFMSLLRLITYLIAGAFGELSACLKAAISFMPLTAIEP